MEYHIVSDKKTCDSCKYSDKSFGRDLCFDCALTPWYSGWEPMDAEIKKACETCNHFNMILESRRCDRCLNDGKHSEWIQMQGDYIEKNKPCGVGNEHNNQLINRKDESNLKKNNVQRHMDVCEELHDLYQRKNQDYGDSFHNTFTEEGWAMVRIRLSDKFSRFKQLSKTGNQMVNDESIRDTLIDLANYSIMAVLEIDREPEAEDKNRKLNQLDEYTVHDLVGELEKRDGVTKTVSGSSMYIPGDHTKPITTLEVFD